MPLIRRISDSFAQPSDKPNNHRLKTGVGKRAAARREQSCAAALRTPSQPLGAGSVRKNAVIHVVTRTARTASAHKAGRRYAHSNESDTALVDNVLLCFSFFFRVFLPSFPFDCTSFHHIFPSFHHIFPSFHHFFLFSSQFSFFFSSPILFFFHHLFFFFTFSFVSHVFFS